MRARWRENATGAALRHEAAGDGATDPGFLCAAFAAVSTRALAPTIRGLAHLRSCGGQARGIIRVASPYGFSLPQPSPLSPDGSLPRHYAKPPSVHL